jgi:hypothetical protein
MTQGVTLALTVYCLQIYKRKRTQMQGNI